MKIPILLVSGSFVLYRALEQIPSLHSSKFCPDMHFAIPTKCHFSAVSAGKATAVETAAIVPTQLHREEV